MNSDSNQKYMEIPVDYLSIRQVQYNSWYLCCWKKFENPFSQINFGRSIKNLCQFICSNNGNQPTSQEQADQTLPILTPNFTSVPGRMKTTWIGHSTFLIQQGGFNILVDPVFGQRASPISWAGPKRYRRPACQLQELPHIHAVFISHDHYDHFDSHTVDWLTEHHNPIFFIGKESRDLFREQARVVELQWNVPVKCAQLKLNVIFFPVCHWSKRGIFDTNKRLWGGFIIQTSEKRRIFYSGDTGYCGVFKQIGQKYPDGFDLALIPIGAFWPRPFLSPQHIDPQQAVLIHQQIHSKKSIGCHWGTFPLGKQHYLAPRQELEATVNQKSLSREEFVCLRHGESLEVATTSVVTK